MQGQSAPMMQRSHRVLLFVGFLIGGLMLFLLGHNWHSLFPTNKSTLKWALVLLFLAFAWAMRRSERFREAWQVPLAARHRVLCECPQLAPGQLAGPPSPSGCQHRSRDCH